VALAVALAVVKAVVKAVALAVEAKLSSLMFTITEEAAADNVAQAYIMLNLNPAPSILDFIRNMEILDRQWFYSDGDGGE
jgi:hypothetical protein